MKSDRSFMFSLAVCVMLKWGQLLQKCHDFHFSSTCAAEITCSFVLGHIYTGML